MDHRNSQRADAPLTNADLSVTEAIVDDVSVKTGVIGTTKTGRDVMITGSIRSDPRHTKNRGGSGPACYDLFLTWEQAAALHEMLGKTLEQGRAAGALTERHGP